MSDAEDVIVGVAGVAGCKLIVTLFSSLTHPDAFFTVTLYVPGTTPVNIVDDWYVVPLMLYVNDEPSGAVTVISPVGTEHVGCVAFTEGMGGVDGCALIVALVPTLTHPSALFTVTL